MRHFLSLTVSLLSVQAIGSYAQADPVEEDVVEGKLQSPSLAVSVSASFPTAEIFGVKLVNGKPTQALISFTNDEPEPVTVKFVGGVLWTTALAPEDSRIVRNLTTTRYNVEIPAGGKQSLPYNFVTELHPQDLRLEIAAIMSSGDGKDFAVQAFNDGVSIVEPDTSIFDPQYIFLYIFLLSCAGGVLYFFYNIWIAPYFPQKRTRGGDKAKKGSSGTRKVDPGESAAALGTDGPAVTTGAKGYNEEWIPAHHIQRPEVKRVKSGNPRPKSRGKVE